MLPISGFQLSLQGQTLLFIQSFHDEKRLELSDLLEKEKWKKSDLDFAGNFREKFLGVESLAQLLFAEGQGSDGLTNGTANSEETKVLQLVFGSTHLVGVFLLF